MSASNDAALSLLVFGVGLPPARRDDWQDPSAVSTADGVLPPHLLAGTGGPITDSATGSITSMTTS